MKTRTKLLLLALAGITWNWKLEIPKRIRISRRLSRFSRSSTLLFFLICTVAQLHNCTSFANNLNVQDIVVDQAGGTVQFKISWNNCWRMSSTTVPYNWDAAWVFVKIRDCSVDPGTVQFTHGLLSTTLADHNLDVLSDGQTFQATNKDGTPNAIDGIPDNTGLMIRRNAVTASGPETVSDTIRLKLTNLPAAGTLDVRVFGLEMVFIPGNGNVAYPQFWVGDGDGLQYSTYSFCTNLHYAYQITGEGAITTGATGLYYSGTPTAYGTVQAGFPKGYNSFYIMKYEISQGQYANFLNCLPDNLANVLGLGGTWYNVNRNMINDNGTAPNKYYSDRENRAANYLSWYRVSSYFDWACLRPLTELQYEKAARGFLYRVPYELAWGAGSQATITKAATISGAENGTETVTTANANVCAGNTTFTGGDAGTGPLRVGIFATAATTTRQATGASYFGVMEMSGNVSEFYISINAGMSGAVSQNGVTLGNGAINNSTAYHDVADWPDPIVSSGNVIRRGGNWYNGSTTVAATNPLNIAFRNEGTAVTQDAYIGGRGGR